MPGLLDVNLCKDKQKTINSTLKLTGLYMVFVGDPTSLARDNISMVMLLFVCLFLHKLASYKPGMN